MHRRVGRLRGPSALLSAGVTVVALAACVPHAARMSVPTDPAIGGTEGDMAGLQGRLEGTANADGSACFWVDGPNGRAFLVTRSGSYATRDLRLHERDAQVVAEVGRDYLFSGAPGRDQRADGCAGEGVVWYTGDIQPAHPDYWNATLPPPDSG